MKTQLARLYYLIALLVLFLGCEDDMEGTKQENKPKIDNLSTLEAIPGDKVKIIGENFGNDKSLVDVLLGQNIAAVSEVQNSEIVFTVPGIDPGEYFLGLTINNVPVSNDLKLNVKVQPLNLRVENSHNYIQHDVVNISANDLPGPVEEYEVLIGTEEASITEFQPDKISFFIPTNIDIGDHEISVVYKGDTFEAGTISVEDWNNRTVEGYSFMNMDNPNYPIHVLDSENNVILPHVNDEGTVDKVYFQYESGEYQLDLNDNGTPSALYSDTKVLLFDGYDLQNGTVNILAFDTNDPDQTYYEFEVPLQESDLEIIGSLNGRTSSTQSNTSEALQAAGLGLSIAGCALSFASLGTPVGWFFIGSSCATAFYDVLKTINPEMFNPAANTLVSVHSVKMSLIGCASTPAVFRNPQQLFGSVLDCINLGITVADGIASINEDLNDNASEQINLFRNSLNTGFGNVKVTLTWNTTADIDLYVTDPLGVTISYLNPTSAATGGLLDVDDVNGFGPENIFWPPDQSPFGNFKVEAHYYGPEGGPTTNYTIIVFNYGESKTFSGTISYNQKINIVEFLSGAGFRAPSQNGRFEPQIEYVDRKLLKEKK